MVAPDMARKRGAPIERPVKPDLRVLSEPDPVAAPVKAAPAKTGPMALVWQLALVALLIGAGYLAWVNEARVQSFLGVAEEPAQARSRGAPAATPVIIAQVGEAEDLLSYELVGTGRALRSVMLRAKGAGRVTAVPITAGVSHAQGDALLVLDDQDERTALALAEARLGEAQRMLQRQERLIASGASTSVRVDEARTAAEIAALEVEAARRALADRTIRAPFDGVTGLTQIDVGDRVENEAPIASFDDNSALLVEFELPEALLSRIESGLAVSATTPAWPDRRFKGEVTAIDTRIDPASRTARVRVTLPNDEGLLRPGASFTVRLELPGDIYPAVPELALQFARGGLHVWRVAGEAVEKVELRMIRRRAEDVLVEGPLQVGDAVVIEGAQRLSTGRAVRIVSGGGG